jgi:hypothetical protein
MDINNMASQLFARADHGSITSEESFDRVSGGKEEISREDFKDNIQNEYGLSEEQAEKITGDIFYNDEKVLTLDEYKDRDVQGRLVNAEQKNIKDSSGGDILGEE